MEGLRTREKQSAGKSLQTVKNVSRTIEEFLSAKDTSASGFSKEYIRNGITIGISSNLDEIAAIRTIWEQIQKQYSSNIPDTDYQKYVSIIKSESGRTEPFVMYLKKDNKLLSIIIGKIHVQSLYLRLGYLSLFRPKLKCLTITYGGIVGEPDERLCHTLVEELTNQLKIKQADMLLFHYIRKDTTFYKVLRNISSYCPIQVKTDKHWRMTIPDSMNEFYSARSRGHRHNLRRAVSKFDQGFSGDIKFVNYSTENDVDDFLKTAAGISEKTYQHALNAGLVDDESTRERIKADAANGWFRGHIVFAGGNPCAFQLGLQYSKTYYMVNMGYDPAFKSYNPGLILFLKVLESLCYDTSIKTLDFYFGDAEYKRRYGTESWQEANICLYAHRAYPMLIKTLQIIVMAMDTNSKYLVDKIGIKDCIKRRWRSLLSSRTAVHTRPVEVKRV